MIVMGFKERPRSRGRDSGRRIAKGDTFSNGIKKMKMRFLHGQGQRALRREAELLEGLQANRMPGNVQPYQRGIALQLAQAGVPAEAKVAGLLELHVLRADGDKHLIVFTHVH